MTRPSSSGFTLIEVLVALVIVAIGMAAVLGALSSSANTVSYLRDKMLSEWVGLNQIANVRLQVQQHVQQQQQVPATGNTTGDLEYAGRKWHWRQEVTALQVKGMVRIDVKVRPEEVKGGDDNGWFVTVSGIAGDAVATPKGNDPLWGSGAAAAGQPNPGGTTLTPSTPGNTPRNPTPGTNPGATVPGSITPGPTPPAPQPRSIQ